MFSRLFKSAAQKQEERDNKLEQAAKEHKKAFVGNLNNCLVTNLDRGSFQTFLEAELQRYFTENRINPFLAPKPPIEPVIKKALELNKIDIAKIIYDTPNKIDKNIFYSIFMDYLRKILTSNDAALINLWINYFGTQITIPSPEQYYQLTKHDETAHQGLLSYVASLKENGFTEEANSIIVEIIAYNFKKPEYYQRAIETIEKHKVLTDKKLSDTAINAALSSLSPMVSKLIEAGIKIDAKDYAKYIYSKADENKFAEFINALPKEHHEPFALYLVSQGADLPAIIGFISDKQKLVPYANDIEKAEYLANLGVLFDDKFKEKILAQAFESHQVKEFELAMKLGANLEPNAKYIIAPKVPTIENNENFKAFLEKLPKEPINYGSKLSFNVSLAAINDAKGLKHITPLVDIYLSQPTDKTEIGALINQASNHKDSISMLLHLKSKGVEIPKNITDNLIKLAFDKTDPKLLEQALDMGGSLDPNAAYFKNDLLGNIRIVDRRVRIADDFLCAIPAGGFKTQYCTFQLSSHNRGDANEVALLASHGAVIPEGVLNDFMAQAFSKGDKKTLKYALSIGAKLAPNADYFRADIDKVLKRAEDVKSFLDLIPESEAKADYCTYQLENYVSGHSGVGITNLLRQGARLPQDEEIQAVILNKVISARESEIEDAALLIEKSINPMILPAQADVQYLGLLHHQIQKTGTEENIRKIIENTPAEDLLFYRLPKESAKHSVKSPLDHLFANKKDPKLAELLYAKLDIAEKPKVMMKMVEETGWTNNRTQLLEFFVQHDAAKHPEIASLIVQSHVPRVVVEVDKNENATPKKIFSDGVPVSVLSEAEEDRIPRKDGATSEVNNKLVMAIRDPLDNKFHLVAVTQVLTTSVVDLGVVELKDLPKYLQEAVKAEIKERISKS